MKKPSLPFILLTIIALMAATIFTWSLLNPKEASGFYETAIGSLPHAPNNQAIGKGVIHFEKTEED